VLIFSIFGVTFVSSLKQIHSNRKKIEIQIRRKKMNKWIVYGTISVVGLILGRLAVRFVLNILLGGTLFGGDLF
jgi:hypothetical protein